MKKSHSYKEAVKKQLSTVIIGFIIIFYLLWQFAPINTPNKFFIFSAIVLLFGGFIFWVVRQAGYKVFCTKCEEDIFPFLHLGELRKSEINYCPICGHKLENIE